MMYRRRTDRPSIDLTPEERRCFAEMASRLRVELDGLEFQPESRAKRWRSAGRGAVARSAAAVMAALRWPLTGPVLALAGGLALTTVAAAGRVQVWGYLPAVLLAAVAVAGWAMTVAGIVGWARRRRRRRRSDTGGVATGPPLDRL